MGSIPTTSKIARDGSYRGLLPDLDFFVPFFPRKDMICEDSLSAKAESFSRGTAYATQRDFRFSVAGDRGASRVTNTQTVSSYSVGKFNKLGRIKTRAIHPSPKELGFLPSEG